MDLSLFPTVNASLNALAGVFLLLGYKAIKSGNRDLHRNMMVCALVSSTVFLACYLTYHWLKAGIVTKYEGEGVMRIIYFFILGTHTPLAAIIVPFCLAAVYQAIKGNFAAHVKITRWLYPAWIYVSITGVLVYLMLYVLPVK